ncbi:hypothetical protein HY490_05500 [Candidatus Woesearchaeota archaeon]|nr:hypothetical protein [Candidatus Woesearchaeota archaeon]
MSSSFDIMLGNTHRLWSQLRLFAYANRTICEVGFITVYAGEQALLILLTELVPDYSTTTISLFALVVLTTFAFHKLVMESRIRILETEVATLKQEMKCFAEASKQTADKYMSLATNKLHEDKYLNEKRITLDYEK